MGPGGSISKSSCFFFYILFFCLGPFFFFRFEFVLSLLEVKLACCPIYLCMYVCTYVSMIALFKYSVDLEHTTYMTRMLPARVVMP